VVTIKRISIALTVGLIVVCIWFYPKLQALYVTMHLFDEDRIVENFRSVQTIWPTKRLEKSSQPYRYSVDLSGSLPPNFSYDNQDYITQAFLKDSWTTGFLVIQDDVIVSESYFLGNNQTTQNISWSMAKSFISALVGIAVDQGQIASIEQAVDVYAPQLKGSGYEGVRIKDVLQMSSGIAFNEDYGDFYSDINRWGRDFSLGNSQDDFAASLRRGVPPGTKNHYVSIDTHVLSMVLSRATGQSITDYMQDNLYTAAGMEHEGYWIADGVNVEMALGGLNLTLRDFAKIGSMYLHDGALNGQQIVPKAWVNDSIAPDGAHVQPGPGFGYGYQWWIPPGNEGEFMAMGVYNQYIYVNPETNTVIAKLSANPHYNDTTYGPSSDWPHLALFRSIAHQVHGR
jgi:CubicO group peptidase (beta-lactamase class C family)